MFAHITYTNLYDLRIINSDPGDGHWIYSVYVGRNGIWGNSISWSACYGWFMCYASSKYSLNMGGYLPLSTFWGSVPATASYKMKYCSSQFAMILLISENLCPRLLTRFREMGSFIVYVVQIGVAFLGPRETCALNFPCCKESNPSQNCPLQNYNSAALAALSQVPSHHSCRGVTS